MGYLGSYHSDKYAALPSVDLVGVVDVKQARAREIAEKHQTQHYSHYKDILDKVDAVSIATTTDQHYEIARACLERGIHVLVEKPITEKVWQAEALLKVAKQKGCVLRVGHLERFNPAIKKASSYLTQPLFVECHRLNPFVGRGVDVDVILDLMIHDIDILLSIVKSRVTRIDAVGTSVLSSTIDIASVRLNFKNGCVANLTASRISLKPMRKMRIFQPDAYLSLDFYNSNVEVYRRIVDPRAKLPEITREVFSLNKGDALAEEIQVFVLAVQNREKATESTQGAFEALKLADQIVRKIERTAKKYYSHITEYAPTYPL